MQTTRPVGGTLAAFIFLSITILSCKGSPNEPQPISSVVFPSKNVSFANQVQPFFDDGCALSGCHDINARAGGLALDSYEDVLTSDPGVVKAGDTTASKLIWSVEGTKGKSRMPLGLPAATSNQINGLKQWILEGARNN